MRKLINLDTKKIKSISLIIFCMLITYQTSCSPNNSSIDEKNDQDTQTTIVLDNSEKESSPSTPQETNGDNEEKPSPTILETRFPQPSIVFQTGSELKSYLNCNEDLNGEIWFLEPPYHNAERILSSPETAYLQPTWSPDGQWIAYWQSEVSGMPSQELEEVSWHFQDDSIWLINSSGEEKHKLTDIFVRSNLTGFDNNCRTTGGILNLIGWSENSQWLAFLMSPEKEEQIEPNLYLININTEEIFSFPNIWTAEWTLRSNILIGLNEQENRLEIIEVAEDISISLIPVPEEIKVEHLPFNANFAEETDTLWVITRPRDNAYNIPRSLWLVNTSTNEWQFLSNIELNANIGGFYITEEFVLICNRGDGSQRDILQIRNHTSLELINEVEAHCDSTKFLFSNFGDVWIGNFNSSVQQSIQISSLQPGTSKTIVDWEFTNITNPRTIAVFDWSLMNFQTNQ